MTMLAPQEADMAEYKAGPQRVAPMHPGAVIADTLEHCRLSARQAAKRMGVSVTTLTRVMNGKAAVTTDLALRIGKLFGNGPELWLAMQNSFDLWHARRKIADALKKIETLPAD
jgi:addiction module HigA family antidote